MIVFELRKKKRRRGERTKREGGQSKERGLVDGNYCVRGEEKDIESGHNPQQQQ